MVLSGLVFHRSLRNSVPTFSLANVHILHYAIRIVTAPAAAAPPSPGGVFPADPLDVYDIPMSSRGPEFSFVPSDPLFPSYTKTSFAVKAHSLSNSVLVDRFKFAAVQDPQTTVPVSRLDVEPSLPRSNNPDREQGRLILSQLRSRGLSYQARLLPPFS